MSLQLRDNLESHLEELSRLRRLGNFTAVFDEVKAELKPFFHSRYVLVQYGQALIEGMRFVELEKLAKEYPPRMTRSAIELNWILLLNRAQFLSDHNFQETSIIDVFSSATALLNHSWPALDSTEFEVLSELLTSHASQLKSEPFDWRSLYHHLRSQERLWEANDLLQKLSYLLGFDVYLHTLFPVFVLQFEDPTSSLIQQVLAEWDLELDDESTLLAWIDIFATLSFTHMKLPGQSDTIKSCLEIARSHSQKLLTHGSSNLKTRPYLRFLVAEAFYKDYSDEKDWKDDVIFSNVGRGILRRPECIFPDCSWPIYQPEDDESPQWSPKRDVKKQCIVDTLQLVHRTAEELGDIKVQAGCLEQLVYHGEGDPEKTLTQLSDLFFTTGYLFERRLLFFSRYLLVNTPLARAQLRLDLLLAGPCVDRDWEHIRYSILAALAITGQEKKLYQDLSSQFPSPKHPEVSGEMVRRPLRIPTNSGTDDYTDESSESYDDPDDNASNDLHMEQKAEVGKAVNNQLVPTTSFEENTQKPELRVSGKSENDQTEREILESIAHDESLWDRNGSSISVDANPKGINTNRQHSTEDHDTNMPSSIAPKRHTIAMSHLPDVSKRGNKFQLEKRATVVDDDVEQ
ncbi:hypothetical protein B0J13DRAFT_616341 [Dactylonectria estremocensis]|uniref:Uncharacterized protein n=1 Tax=Dactylonectria estremocensis TaxID=1079267 RepID=A0A9P9FCX6_9HYPO|nr:hypothetical protein B0J13DRAFT_616341 [Dactylonectria estremocensis]